MWKKIVLILLVVLLLVGDGFLVADMLKGGNLMVNIITIVITLPLIIYFISFYSKSEYY
ncbi:MAG: hypothetical protein K9M44_02855 [Candidatus Pacebacteria bacterium]|nr:hypothetical protein [Candidatus Paceibacterota bacterium]